MELDVDRDLDLYLVRLRLRRLPPVDSTPGMGPALLQDLLLLKLDEILVLLEHLLFELSLFAPVVGGFRDFLLLVLDLEALFLLAAVVLLGEVVLHQVLNLHLHPRDILRVRLFFPLLHHFVDNIRR